MNSVTLVGRLVQDPEVKTSSDGTCRTLITVAVCVLWNGIASATKDYCHKGDVVGIKGKLQTRTYETDDNEKKHLTEVIVDKVTFISSSPKKA